MTRMGEFTSERYVDTPTGSVFVRETVGEGPPIVLMHGFPDDHRIHDNLVPRLSPRHTVAFDWLGYGRSDRLDTSEFLLGDHVSQLTAVLDGLDIASAVLVGQDAPGPDAVAFTVVQPQRVDHLVFLNTVLGHRASLKLPELIRLLAEAELASLADAMINNQAQRLWLLQFTADRWGMDALDPEGIALRSVLPQFFGDAEQPDAFAAIRAWTAGLFLSSNLQDALVDSGVLRQLAVPVSVIFVQDDRYLNRSLAAEIAGLFRDASLDLVPRASHWPQHDQPDVVAELLKVRGNAA